MAALEREAHRAASAATTGDVNQVLDFWANALTPPKAAGAQAAQVALTFQRNPSSIEGEKA